MRINYKTRKTISQVLSIVLLVALGVTAIFGVSALSKKLQEDKKIIHPTFEVGSINADGKGNRNDDGSIFTKEAFECAGLEVKLDFDAQIKYSIFYYDDMDTFIMSDEDNTESKKASVPSGASHARLVVTPIWDSKVAKEDRVCHWYDVTKYSSQLEISVDKVQEVAEREYVTLVGKDFVLAEDLSELTFVKHRVLYTGEGTMIGESDDATGYANSYGYALAVSGGETISLTSAAASGVNFAVFEFKDGAYVAGGTTWSTGSVTLTADTEYIIIQFKNAADTSTDFTKNQLAKMGDWVEIN